MTLNQDKLRGVFEKYIRFNIDAAQGMSYCLNSKYEEGTENFLKSIKALQDIIDDIKS
jgi:hypothetical protein